MQIKDVDLFIKKVLTELRAIEGDRVKLGNDIEFDIGVEFDHHDNSPNNSRVKFHYSFKDEKEEEPKDNKWRRANYTCVVCGVKEFTRFFKGEPYTCSQKCYEIYKKDKDVSGETE